VLAPGGLQEGWHERLKHQSTVRNGLVMFLLWERSEHFV
jgi:hypothetical protein